MLVADTRCTYTHHTSIHIHSSHSRIQENRGAPRPNTLRQVSHTYGAEWGVRSTIGSKGLPQTLHIQLMSSPSPHLIWFKSHTRCMETSSTSQQSHVIIHAFTTTLHSLLLRTIILPCSTHIPFSFQTLFTSIIHPIHGFPLNKNGTQSNRINVWRDLCSLCYTIMFLSVILQSSSCWVIYY